MRSRVLDLTWLPVLLGLAQGAAAEERLWLVREGVPQVVIAAGDGDDYAARRLARWLVETTGGRPEIVSADRPAPVGGKTVILVGSAASNRLLRDSTAATGAGVDPSRLTPQGYLARRLTHGGRQWLLLAGGGPDGTRYAVADLIHQYAEHRGRDAWLGPLDTCQRPRFLYRWLWNWDHRMDWGGAGRAGTLMGGETYRKSPQAFLTDCRRCLDFMADHKFNGLILWGLLRDTHGGVAAAQEICRYAAERGVRILPGVGTSDYGGYYFEGRREFNVETWLAAHPELRAIAPNGKPHNALCPSKAANRDWLDRGAAWLFANFQVGGVNLEMGDFYVCHCDECRRARAAILSDEADYYKDMALSHMATLRTMRRLKPDAWLSYATYTGYTAEMMRRPPQFLAMIPDDAICQWSLAGVTPRWDPKLRPMARHNLGYLYWCNRSTHTEQDFYLDEVREICRRSAQLGFEGLDTYGELSDSWPNAEINYLAWEAFLWQPEMTGEQFVRERLGRLYGGPAAAAVLTEIIPLVRTSQERQDPARCQRAVQRARSARAAAAPEGQEHWDRLLARLEQHAQAARQLAEERRRQEVAARCGAKIAIAAVKASDEDPQRGWTAAKAIDGSTDEPAGYWLTRNTHPRSATLELTLAAPAAVDRVALYHQLNPGHYRSRDYQIAVRVGGQWQTVVKISGNTQSGWVGHQFPAVTADAVRLEITRSEYGGRMGVGEIEVRYVKE
jgi:hypothetical protein